LAGLTNGILALCLVHFSAMGPSGMCASNVDIAELAKKSSQ